MHVNFKWERRIFIEQGTRKVGFRVIAWVTIAAIIV
jgi:hypothetical protein